MITSTHGTKNKAFLMEFKDDLARNVELYLSRREMSERMRNDISNNLGKNFMKLSELATLNLYWNKEVTQYGSLGWDISDAREFIVEELWKIVANKKLNIKRFKNRNSAYNFFLFCAKRFSMYYTRRHLKRRNLRKFTSINNVENYTYDANEIDEKIDNYLTIINTYNKLKFHEKYVNQCADEEYGEKMKSPNRNIKKIEKFMNRYCGIKMRDV